MIKSFPETLGKLFLERVRATPELSAIDFPVQRNSMEAGRSSLTFAQLHYECRYVSIGLRALGFHPGMRAAMLVTHRPAWMICDLAVQGCGGIWIPIDSTRSDEDLALMLEDSDPHVLFLESQEILDRVRGLLNLRPKLLDHVQLKVMVETERERPVDQTGDGQVISLEALKDFGRQQEPLFRESFETELKTARPEDVFTIHFTAGTEDTPKGVRLTHSNLLSVLWDCRTAFQEELEKIKGPSIAIYEPSQILARLHQYLSFAMGWEQLFPSRNKKAESQLRDLKPSLLFCRSYVLQELFDELHGQRENQSSAPLSTLFSRLRDNPISNTVLSSPLSARLGGKVRSIFCAGPLEPQVIRFFLESGVLVYEGYGLTETCGPVAVNTPRARKDETAGRPLLQSSIKISKSGEITVKSPGLFPGYINTHHPSSSDLDGFFRTGDMGYLDEDGYLHIIERKEKVIRLRDGKTVYPSLIEKKAKETSYIQDILLIGQDRPFLSALITLRRERILAYADRNHILFSDYETLIRNAQVLALLQKTFDTLNRDSESGHAIRRFAILPEEYLPVSARLRTELLNRYRPTLDELYY